MISTKRKVVFFSELHSLLSSGMDLNNTFNLLYSNEQNPRIKSLINGIHNSVISGSSLWNALEKTNEFSPLDYGVIRIGEETGKIADSTSFLFNYYQNKIEQQRMLWGALSYPIIIFITAITVVVFMILVIVPMFEQVYSRLGGVLPKLTIIIIGASKLLPEFIILFSTVILVLSIVRHFIKGKDYYRAKSSSLLLSLPLIGSIIKKNNQARFCSLMHLLTSSGLSITYCLSMVSGILTFFPYQNSLFQMEKDLNEGEMLTDGIAKFPNLYSSKLRTLIRVAEETNSLPVVFRRQSEEISKELSYKIKLICNMMEPALIIFVGALVAIILISMYLPMFRLGSIMS